MTTASASSTELLIASMLSGSLSDEEIVRAFEGMEAHPLTTDQLIGGARAMRGAMVPVALPGDPLDTCGTGGSGKMTINTSTMVAFIVAAAGEKIAKHGNRSASGNCGSFDVLEALGARIELTPEQERAVYDELGIVFLFAKTHHPAMRHVAAARKTFGRRTIFNLLGPLCNPAGVRRQVIGTGNLDHARMMAAALGALGSDHSLVAVGEDGLDEVTVCARSTIITVPGGRESHVAPASFGVEPRQADDIAGGSMEDNVAVLRELAAGRGEQAHRDLVVVNAAYALMLSGDSSLGDALAIARATLASGAVARLIDRYVAVTNDCR